VGFLCEPVRMVRILQHPLEMRVLRIAPALFTVFRRCTVGTSCQFVFFGGFPMGIVHGLLTGTGNTIHEASE